MACWTRATGRVHKTAGDGERFLAVRRCSMAFVQLAGGQVLHRERFAQRADCFDGLVLALHPVETCQHLAPFAEPAFMQQLFDVSARLVDRCEFALGEIVDDDGRVDR
jgi:hypothetical protein